jgi:probable rRNA maturation factor
MSDVRFIMSDHQHVGFDAGVLPSIAERVLRSECSDLLTLGPLTVSLVWVDDKEIQSMNKQYRQKDEPTDILSFPMLEGRSYPAGGELGDLFVSLDTLRRQAAEHGHDEATEASILLVHGLLHLLGYDHETPAELESMLSLEKKYLGDNAGLIERSTLDDN